METIKKDQKELILLSVLIITFIVDAVHAIVVHYWPEKVLIYGVVSWSALPRGIFFDYLMFLYFKELFCEKGRNKQIFFSFVFVAWFFYSLTKSSSLLEVGSFLVYNVKVILPFLVYWYISKIKELAGITKVIIVFFVIQSAVVLFAFLFDIELFKTYKGSQRFGYYGLMVAFNQLSFVYITVLYLLIFNFHKFIGKFNLYIIFIVVLASSFLGTKATWGSLFLLAVAVFISQYPSKSIKISFFLALFFSFLLIYLEKKGLNHFRDLYENKGAVYTITSRRNLIFQDIFLPYIKNAQWDELLFGGVKVRRYFVELDFLDILSYGGLGMLLLYIYTLTRTLFNFKDISFVKFMFIFTFLVNGLFTGSSIVNGLNFVVLPLTCVFFQRKYR
jgi:hypothetical protein